MKRLLIFPVLLLTLLVGTPASSADWKKGAAAYQSSDFATALREWTPLAKQGNADAQFNLGLMYHEGQGVPQDDKTAVKWYKLAAEQWDAGAQYNLGVMYYNGHGVIKDYVYAHMWWNIAASSGYKDAVTNRDIVAKRMTPSQLETAQKLARECISKKYKGCESVGHQKVLTAAQSGDYATALREWKSIVD
jgi:TPR repeat protein